MTSCYSQGSYTNCEVFTPYHQLSDYVGESATSVYKYNILMDLKCDNHVFDLPNYYGNKCQPIETVKNGLSANYIY